MSKVKILNKDERLVHGIGETNFFYKRISPDRAAAIRRKHTRRGDMNASAAGFEILESHLLGWENVQDWDDNDIPFTPENIRLIPDEVLAELITAISSSDGELATTVESAVKAPDKTVKNS